MDWTVLMVDQKPSVLELVRIHLRRCGFRILTAASGKEALTTANSSPVDLLVLDSSLPDMSASDVCRQFRHRSRTPVIILCDGLEEAQRIRYLEIGADECVDKPFGARELVARIKAHLRRWSWSGSDLAARDEILTVGPLTINPAGRQVYLHKKELHLTPMEFDILRVLCSLRGRVIPRERLLAMATGQETIGSARTIDVHVRSLRLKLETDPSNPKLLETVRGAGYCLGRRYPGTLVNQRKEGYA